MIGKHLSSAIVRNVRASRASDCAASSWRARPRCSAPFFAARPASRRGLRTALPLRSVLVLGASHPYCGPPRFASRASDCAASSRRARPRCFAPFFAARPASRRGLRTAPPRRGVLVLGASPPYCGPPLFSFPCPFLSKEKPPARLFRRPGACLSWLTFSPFSGQCRESGKSSSHIRCR